MTQAINKLTIQENTLLDKFRNLKTILDFVEFIESKKYQSQKNQEQEVSAYDLAKEWAGSVESGIGDLSTK